MTDNATPEPQSDEEQTGTKRVIRKALIGTGLVTTFERLCAEIEINALQAQPPPVPLAEDEALIEDLLELAESNDVYICDPEFKHRDMEIEDTLRAVAERLSLRSGQLAQVLALKGGPSCNQCIRMVAHVDEIRAIVEGKK